MKKTPLVWVILAFLVVGIPLGWGLYRSLVNSKPLFSKAPAAPAPAVAAHPERPVPGASTPVRATAPAPARLFNPSPTPARPVSAPAGPPPPDS